MDVLPRFAITFEAIRENETIDFGIIYSAPSSIHIPLPGDEVVLPAGLATEKGFTGNLFKVEKRQFLYTEMTGVAGAVCLILSRDK